MITLSPTALIADDEPLLRDALVRQLSQAWPALQVLAQARNGRQALEMFEQHQPDVCFLDIRMPTLSGVEVAQAINRRAHVVFVTAHDDYAVQAFTEGALDYLVKPVEPARLVDTVTRLQARMHESKPPLADLAEQLKRLEAQLTLPLSPPKTYLQWIHAQCGATVRLIPVDAVDYFQSDTKYTRVAWRDESDILCEAILSMTITQLAEILDPQRFAQVHRSSLVNLHAILHLVRGENETARIYLRRRSETLPVSRRYLPQFRAF
ncbi:MULTISPECIES: LytTR family DNA-binding domain-containing protein [Xanthomonas]|uniref:DNA-binding LytR/AlgR family response regulator n=1 Tax=Xanthomonas cannabis TaxID=1885674 RepID=A0ABR6JPW6_9XANT|nr:MULTISPECIES: LytTR family DNA-binding domain-containing protein [Xanthomonas]MBB4594847.1 DNA-binding LytR/AlgR family response regulator [Xanthomonas cannabis]MBB5523663.1 DNA-binding LytR/AlgR family response regulator [Xanthomonas cannabis]MBO9855833.1 response regulator transcription factor [Xanthomonas sp. A1809]